MEGKFLGLGLPKLLGVAVFVMILIVVFKVIFTKYPVNGVTEFVNTI